MQQKKYIRRQDFQILWNLLEERFGQELTHKTIENRSERENRDLSTYSDFRQAIDDLIDDLRKKGDPLGENARSLGRSAIYDKVYRFLFRTEESSLLFPKIDIEVLIRYAGYADREDFEKNALAGRSLFHESANASPPPNEVLSATNTASSSSSSRVLSRVNEHDSKTENIRRIGIITAGFLLIVGAILWMTNTPSWRFDFEHVNVETRGSQSPAIVTPEKVEINYHSTAPLTKQQKQQDDIPPIESSQDTSSLKIRTVGQQSPAILSGDQVNINYDSDWEVMDTLQIDSIN